MNRASTGVLYGARGALDLLVALDLQRGRMRRSLQESLRHAIQEGRLAAGTRLPSSRRLSADLGVSRGVVSDTYDQLASEGYLDVEPRSAPVVGAVVPGPPAVVDSVTTSWRYDFIASTPDVSLFPRRGWIKAIDRAMAVAPDDAFDYGDHRGRIELRRALSAYLGRVRGVRVDPGRIVVTQGFTQALDLLCRVLLAGGATTMAMETPSTPDLHQTVRQTGLRLVGCPVDDHGLQTTELSRLHADAVCVAPAHQFPTGAVMSPKRRLSLLQWAGAAGALVIEDDYDAEFRYDRTAVGAIQGLDPARVAHVATASKVLAPGVRLAWMSLPDDFVAEVTLRKGLCDSGSPAIDQLALAELLTSGEYDRHVVRARHVYRRRRDTLITAIARKLPTLHVQGAQAGIHVLLRLPRASHDDRVAAEAAARGIGVRPLSPMHLAPSDQRGLLLGYGRLPERRIPRAVDALTSVLVDLGVAKSERHTNTTAKR
jgi:GntR family transcriptional regulator / MocR family aminotransferase